MLLSIFLSLSSLLSLFIQSSNAQAALGSPVLSEETQYVMLDRTPLGEMERRVSFYAVGDNLIHHPIYEFAHVEGDTYDFKPIYEPIAPNIDSAYLAFINQETILGGDDRGFSGYPAFNTPSDMARSLVDLGFDIVVGSNNHTLDMGVSGVLNTLDYWSTYEDEVLFTGAFESQEHRDTIPVIEENGLTFSVLTYTYGTNGILPDAPYRVNYFDPELITQDVTRAKEISDFVIVSAHWGDEHALFPNAMQQEYAQLFADLGVDVVVGTHSHTIQPIEWVAGESGNEMLVIYSLGNLIAASLSDINMLGGSVAFEFVQKGSDAWIEKVMFEPLLIHYEYGVPGDIDSRTFFTVIPLDEYTAELKQTHALNNYPGNIISRKNYQSIVEEVIAEEFRE